MQFALATAGSALMRKRGRRIVPLNPNRVSLRRLRAELTKALHAFFQRQAPHIAAQINALRHPTVSKMGALSEAELAELERVINGISFADWVFLPADVKPVLEEMAADGGVAALAQIHFDTEARPEVLNVVNQDAVDYARDRSAEMVGMRVGPDDRLVPNPDAEWRIDDGTRDYLRAATRDAITEGWSNDRLASEIQSSYAFSEARAMTIARTETNRASNAGALNAYVASGVVDGKQWSTAEDDLVSDDCAENGEAGPNGDGVLLDLAEEYPSGDEAPPAHPNCRCVLVPFIDFNAADAGQPNDQE